MYFILYSEMLWSGDFEALHNGVDRNKIVLSILVTPYF